jgi:hypothetical protein
MRRTPLRIGGRQEIGETEAVIPDITLALVIPVGGSCRRQDSRNGDNLFSAAAVLRTQRRSTQRSATAPTTT